MAASQRRPWACAIRFAALNISAAEAEVDAAESEEAADALGRRRCVSCASAVQGVGGVVPVECMRERVWVYGVL